MDKEYYIANIFENYSKPNSNGRKYPQEEIVQMIKNYKMECKNKHFGELSHPDRYTFGVDLAEGKDYTSISVVDIPPKKWMTSSTAGKIKINWQITK